MKKVYLVILISLAVLCSTALWVFHSGFGPAISELVPLGIIIVLVIFGLVTAYRRYSSVRMGQPAEDEMTKTIMQKASSLSYFISLYYWLFIMYITDKMKTDPEIMFGAGILGMGVILLLSWLYYYFIELRNE